MCKYPNILVINEQSIWKNNATGITLQSILQAWPREYILEWCMENSQEYDNKENAFESRDVSKYFPVRDMVMKGYIKSGIKKSYQTVTEKQSIKQTIKKEIKKVFIDITDLSPMRISKKDWEDLNRFKPEVIYTLGSSVAVMKLAAKVSDKYDIPIVLHFMDDWPHYLQDEKGIIRRLYKSKLGKWLEVCYKRSIKCFAISPQMADNYYEETGIPHVPLMNSVSEREFFCEPRKSENELIFTYAGGLHLERWRALNEVAQVIKKIKREFNKKVVMKIYTKQEDINKYETKFDEDIVQFYQYVSHDKIHDVYNETDVLLHTEVNNPVLNGYFRFSISTKIPEYLASNRRVLFYGPSNIGLYSYLKENEVAYVAGNKMELEKVLREILGDNTCGEEMCEKAFELVRKNHNITLAQERFYNTILQIISL